jgi:hypothetical protein
MTGRRSSSGNGSLALGVSWGAILVLGISLSSGSHTTVFAAPGSAAPEARIPVRYTDVRESAKITFQQDSTQTEEKYYLETMGTGVGWIDYDQDGLMDLFLRSICPYQRLQTAAPLAKHALPQ